MVDPAGSPHHRLALIASNQEWSLRALDSILGPSGYAVTRAHTGIDALAKARSQPPDTIILDTHLPDFDVRQLCRALRSDPQLGPGIPIIVISSDPPARAQRLEALRAGAWEYFGYPLDAQELLLKLDTYWQAKSAGDRASEGGLLDQATGFYNLRGLERRAKELGSAALRSHTPLACVVIGTQPERSAPGAGSPPADAAFEIVAGVLARAGRVSDAIARLGRGEFGILAPATDATGAATLAERMVQAIDQAPSESGARPAVRAGYEAITDVHATRLEPVDLLGRAAAALRVAWAEGGRTSVRRYDGGTRGGV